MALKVQRAQELLASEVGPHPIKILVGGSPGAGKTRSASTWPDVLYADVEGRLLSVRDRNVPAVSISTISQLDELRAALSQEPGVREKLLGLRVQTVVIDTVDEVARLLEQERLRSEKLDGFRMQDWGWFGDTLRSMLRGFRNLPINVVFNVHLKSDSDGETGRIIEKPQIKGQVGDELAGYVDIAGLLVARSVMDPKTGERVPKRYLQTYQDSSHTWPKDHTGSLPGEFEINLNDDYARLSKLIFGDVPAAEVKLSTSEPAKPRGKKVPVLPRMSDESGMGRTVVDSPLPEPTPVIPESVPTSGTEPDLLGDLGTEAVEDAPKEQTAAVPVCADCGVPVTNADQLDISLARWNVPLCRADFGTRKARKK